MTGFTLRLVLGGGAAMLLAGCVSPDHTTPDHWVDAQDNLLQPPRQNETLGEAILREQQNDGCLVAGNLGRDACDGMEDVLEPPSLPGGVTLPPSPPPASPPAR